MSLVKTSILKGFELVAKLIQASVDNLKGTHSYKSASNGIITLDGSKPFSTYRVPRYTSIKINIRNMLPGNRLFIEVPSYSTSTLTWVPSVNVIHGAFVQGQINIIEVIKHGSTNFDFFVRYHQTANSGSTNGSTSKNS